MKKFIKNVLNFMSKVCLLFSPESFSMYEIDPLFHKLKKVRYKKVLHTLPVPISILDITTNPFSPHFSTDYDELCKSKVSKSIGNYLSSVINDSGIQWFYNIPYHFKVNYMTIREIRGDILNMERVFEVHLEYYKRSMHNEQF